MLIVSFMTREEIEKRMDELASKYVEKRDPEIIEELDRLRIEHKRLEGRSDMQNDKVEEMQNCLVFVEGKECGLPLAQVDCEAQKIARYDLVTCECGLGHHSYFLLEPESKARPSDTPTTRQSQKSFTD